MTDRQAQYRESKAKARKAKRAAGLAPLEVWAKPSDHAAIRAFVAGWQPVDSAPYETPVLTLWLGNEKRAPVMLINTKNSGANLGKRDNWWHSLPEQQPQLWMPLPLVSEEIGTNLTQPTHPSDGKQ